MYLLTCDGKHERGDADHSSLDYGLTQHLLHCPVCDVHLTSLLLCPGCGTRYEIFGHKRGDRSMEEVQCRLTELESDHNATLSLLDEAGIWTGADNLINDRVKRILDMLSGNW